MPGDPAVPGASGPTTFAEAVDLLNVIHAKLTQISTSAEITDTRKLQVEDFLTYTGNFRNWMNEANAGTEAERLNVFLNGGAGGTPKSYVSSLASHRNAWEIVRLTNSSTSQQQHKPTAAQANSSTSRLPEQPVQTTIVDAAALTFTPSAGGTSQPGQLVKMLPGAESPIYFKTLLYWTIQQHGTIAGGTRSECSRK